MPSLVGKVRSAGFASVDLLLIDSVIHGFWLREIEHRASVLRVADRMSGFPQFTREMRRLQAELVRLVDVVAYTALELGDEVGRLGARQSVHLPNGVDFEHFVRADADAPPDLAGVPRPIAIYAGAIDEWFDFEVVNHVAAALPRVSFVLIGPDHLARTRVATRSNVHLLGPRSYRVLPRYLGQAAVGLIPFDVAGHRDLVETIHPLKLYEYLAAGLPVVAADWRELRNLGSPALLYRTPEEAVELIDLALNEPRRPDAGIEFARAAKWDTRLKSLLNAVASAT